MQKFGAQGQEPPFTTRRGPISGGEYLAAIAFGGPLGLASSRPGCPGTHQSATCSQTFPAISKRPYLLGGKEAAGAVPWKPSSTRSPVGKVPCPVLAFQPSPGPFVAPPGVVGPARE